jgi:hypothetical protein
MAVLLAGCALRAGAPSQSSDSLWGVLSLQVEGTPQYEPLNRQRMVLRDGDKGREVPVVLESTIYRYRGLSVEKGQVAFQSGRLCSYDLRAIDNKRPFSWSICAPETPLGMFRLLTDKDGRNYLAWVDGGLVCFAEIRAARDRAAAIVDAASTGGGAFPGMVRIPTDTLIDREYHFPGDRPANAFYSEFIVDDIEVRETGAAVVTISSPRKPARFRLLFDGKAWRVASDKE